MFSIITDERLLDKQSFVLDAGVTGTLVNGMVAHLASDGEVVYAATTNGIGVFYDFLSNIEPPSTANLVQLAGKQVTVVLGRFEALLTADLFDSGTAPTTPGAALYLDNVSGYVALSGTNKCGYFKGTETTRSVTGDVTLYRCQFNFPVPLA